MSHPELGRYGKSVLYGELAGTIGAVAANAVLSPTAAAVLKAIAGIGLGWFGLRRMDETGVTAYQAGVRLLTSVVEQFSYPHESSAIISDVQSKKPFYLRIDEWKATSVKSATSTSYNPPPAPTVSRVVVSQTYVPQPTTQAQQSQQRQQNKVVEI
jgi:hypothetical protein